MRSFEIKCDPQCDSISLGSLGESLFSVDSKEPLMHSDPKAPSILLTSSTSIHVKEMAKNGRTGVCSSLSVFHLKEQRHRLCILKTLANLSKSSFPIRFNLLYPKPSLFLLSLVSTFWCFSSQANHYF